MERLTGVVLCGGESRRMGTDKGLIPIGDTVWAAHMARKLEQAGVPFLVSVNPSQVESYGRYFDRCRLIIDQEPGGGPLSGVLSAHMFADDSDLLVLACDMIDMQPETLSLIISAYLEERGFDYYAFQNGDFAEPLCTIYTVRALDRISSGLVAGSYKPGLQQVLNTGKTRRLPIIHLTSFANYNSL